MRNRGPLLHDLVDNGQWLLIRCLHCGREKVISGHEACYVYGHGLTFDELRSIIKARCTNASCRVNAGVAPEHWVPVVKHAKPP